MALIIREAMGRDGAGWRQLLEEVLGTEKVAGQVQNLMPRGPIDRAAS
jgi:hypothetical protein